MDRRKTLETAMEYVLHDRNKDYQDPEDNFSDIAHLWSWWLKTEITPLDVAMMSGFIKVARMKGNPYKEDNFVDLAGYAACAAECAENEQKRLNCLGVPEDTYEKEPVEEPGIEGTSNFNFHITMPFLDSLNEEKVALVLREAIESILA